MKIIDAVGQNCPIPVLMAKKEYDGGERAYIVKVDNKTACENLSRFADSQGGKAEVTPEGNIFQVVLNFTDANIVIPTANTSTGSYAIFCGNNILGHGSEELGTNLITMFFYTLAQSDRLPSHICFVNNGVKLVAENEQVIEHLNEIIARGVKVLVCGACLNYYGLTPKAGQTSNMYDILTTLQDVPKVVTL